MEPIKLSLENAVELAEAAVAKRGADYVHQSDCVYGYTETDPACLVGEMFYLKGRLEDAYDYCNDDGVLAMYNQGFLECDLTTLELLKDLQRDQDHGRTWGLALQKAKYLHAPQFLEDLSADQLEETTLEGVQQ